jgi:ornithine--oxo-acid transaminase
MAFDLDDLIARRRGEKTDLHNRHLNAQLVRVLRTIGFDADYVRAEGPYLYDRDGGRYLDLLSGFGVFALGRNHPTVIRALERILHGALPGLVQLDVSLLAGLLAERLVARMPWLDKVYFGNSGAEAVEAAIKFSRAATGRPRVVHCAHAYHGLTYGALSLTGDGFYRERFEPLLGDCTAVPFDDLAALEHALAPRDVAAFVVEPIQGKGVILPGDGYLAGAARLCRESGTLLVADEIQTGMGRTGRFLACEHWSVEPDIVLLGKVLSGGFVPVSAVVCRGWIFERVFDRMDRAVVHGSTFSKNDLAMAAGLATLAVLDEEGLVERAAERGERLVAGLRHRLGGSELVKEVRGKGMMIALEFGPPRSLKLKAAYALMERASRGLVCQLALVPLFRRHKILAQVAGHELPVIKLLPPLVLGEDDLAWIEAAFEDVVAETESLGAFWDLGRTLAAQAMRARAGAT